jgi:hypothetical protein
LIGGLLLSLLITAFEIMYKAKIVSKRAKIDFVTVLKSKIRLSVGSYDEKTIEALKQLNQDMHEKRNNSVIL